MWCVRHRRGLLARQLLRAADYDAHVPLAAVELLKLRFGDASMHACEVRRHTHPSTVTAQLCIPVVATSDPDTAHRL